MLFLALSGRLSMVTGYMSKDGPCRFWLKVSKPGLCVRSGTDVALPCQICIAYIDLQYMRDLHPVADAKIDGSAGKARSCNRPCGNTEDRP